QSNRVERVPIERNSGAYAQLTCELVLPKTVIAKPVAGIRAQPLEHPIGAAHDGAFEGRQERCTRHRRTTASPMARSSNGFDALLWPTSYGAVGRTPA